MSLRFRSDELDNYSIHSDWHLASDHVLLIITILIVKEHIQMKKYIIVKNNKEEKIFINKVIKAINDIDISNLSDVISLENIVCSFAWKTVEGSRRNDIILCIIHIVALR